MRDIPLINMEFCNMGGRVKLGSSKNRGYCGWHTTWLGVSVFLRSKCEFIYARFLDENKIPYLTEKMIYNIADRNYKPDFFIYSDDKYSKLIRIVEVKDSSNYDVVYDTYCDYFSMIDIEYVIVCRFKDIINDYNLNDDIKKWIETSIQKYDNIVLSGNLNPMYGVSQSERTKRIISDKCKTRNENIEYIEKCKKSQEIYWNSELGSIRKVEISNQRRLQERDKRIKYENENPLLIFQCKCCNADINSRIMLEFCSSICKRNWNYKNDKYYGKHKTGTSYKKNLIFYIDKIKSNFNIDTDTFISNIDYYVSESKKIKLIPKNKGITLNTINKYKLFEEI